MPGPIPKPDGERRRRNPPAIPTTGLPAGGREGRAPKCPYELGPSARAWWRWAWSTPQAVGWSTGDLYVLARRAQLEDDLTALEGPNLELDGLVATAMVGEPEALSELKWLIGRLKSMAAGRVAVMREMRELDDRFGLTPKGMAALRWKIVDDRPSEKSEDEVSRRRQRRVRAVDPEATDAVARA